MAKYVFKVYYQNGTTDKVEPTDLLETDLHNIDKYIIDNGGIFELRNKLAKIVGKNVSDITKVSILRVNKQIEFSVVSANKYLEPVLDSVKTRKIQGNGNYMVDAVLVSSDNPVYKEMREYVYENIRGDHHNFLNNIYSYDNEFARLLNQYGSIYNKGLYLEEDARRIRELELKIDTDLRIYKNYRGMSIMRLKHEMTIPYIRKNNNNQVRNVNIVQIPSDDYMLQKPTTKMEADQNNYFVNDAGEEREEFLEPEEYDRFR